MVCPSCRATVADGSRFCANCGHDLEARADERRVVTVLFGDLVGFTAMAEQADPERIKLLIDQAFERLVADIVSFGGRVDKIIGDAIVALFGAPVAHEDDPERAVRAALAMQETLAEYRADTGFAVHMRIGINTGEVLTGAMRAGGDYTAMGDVVNTANRLQTLAQPGQVLVGAATHSATSHAIAYDLVGSVQARGREDPVEAWLASGVLVLPGRQPRRRRSPLIGRDAELSLLRPAIRLAISRRRASLLLLLGDSGVGKTRLADELAEWAGKEFGAELVDSHCLPYGEANVWYPIGAAVAALCGIADDATAAEAWDHAVAEVSRTFTASPDNAAVQQVANALLFLMGHDTPLLQLEPQRAREEAGRSLLRFIEARTTSQPLVLRVADLHWADDLVLALIDDLLHRLTRSPFVLIAGARHLLDPRWSPRAGRYNHHVLNLDPLDRDAAVRMLEAMLPGDALSPSLRDSLIARSGGNPFFLEELVALSRRGESEELEAEVAELPETLRGLVAARLDRLPPVEREVLEDAAVVGASGPVIALEMLSKRRGPNERWRASLDMLADRELLEVRGQRWSFRSDLVREVAYSTLTKADRVRLHAAIARWTEEQLGPDQAIDDAVVNRIAHHYGVAATLARDLVGVGGLPRDLTGRALQWLGEAGRRAESAEVHVVASRLYSSALDLAGAEPSAERLAFLLGRAEAKVGLFELDAAARDVDAALAVAEHLDDRHGQARALLRRAEIARRGNQPDHAMEPLDAALSIARDLGDGAVEAEALRQQGMARLYQGNYADAESATSTALDRFRALGDRRGEAWALQNLAWIAYLSGRVSEAEARIAQSAATFSELGDTGGLAWANGLLSFTRFHQGQLAEAETLAEQILPDARDRGDRFGEAMMLQLTALVRLWSGRTGAAIERAEEARQAFVRMGDALGTVQACAVHGRALVAAGRIEEGLAELSNLAEEAVPVAGEPGGSLGALALAGAALHLGDPGLAAAVEQQVTLPDDGTLGAEDRLVTHGLYLLQSGRFEEAAKAMADEPAGPLSPSFHAVRAAAKLALGDPSGALADADRTHDSSRATYLDLAQAHVAAGFAHAQQRDISEVIAAFGAARQEVDSTGDVVAQAVVRLAESFALAAVSATSARGVRREADRRLTSLGFSAEGWAVLFTAAAQP
jgi:class 3 adenylate cyclase/tetratricopeptide (TPR) repeat protein